MFPEGLSVEGMTAKARFCKSSTHVNPKRLEEVSDDNDLQLRSGISKSLAVGRGSKLSYSLVLNVTHMWLIWHMWFNKPM